MSKKVFIKTFGCQMNVRDSEMIAGILQEKGYVLCNDPYAADVVIYNTCSVRNHAEERVWGQVGALLKKMCVRKKRSREMQRPIVGIVGCMAQTQQKKIFQRLEEVDFIAGPAHIFDIPDLIDKALRHRAHYAAVEKKERPVYSHHPAQRENGFAAYVSIMEGCNNFCSYCVVPYVRGREVSRPPEHILEEIRQLIDKGYKDITLLGQNVNSYGKNNGYDFVTLLERIDRIAQGVRIRFMTSHPKDAHKKLFQAIRDLPSVCEFLHMPFQAGSNRILTLMNRGYTIEYYKDLVSELRSFCPECSLSTDVIVGFPTETDEEFAQTLKVFEELRFDMSYLFQYSPRPYTRARELPDDVSASKKKQRLHILLTFHNDLLRKNHEALIGTTQEVLAETKAQLKELFQDHNACNRKPYCLRGRTRTNQLVFFTASKPCVGEYVPVLIQHATASSLIGAV